MKGAIFFLLLVACLTVARDFEGGGAYAELGYGRSLKPERKDWMSRLPENTRLFMDVTIPGTHNSGSFVYKGLVAHQCQTENIKRQLEAGVRFLDIRVVFIFGKFRVTHGILPTLEFSAAVEDVFSDIRSFLQENPREVVIARVKKEDPGLNTDKYAWNKRVALETFRKFEEIIDKACENANCMIGPSRGKIVFLDDGTIVPEMNFQRYHAILSRRQDDYGLVTNWDLYSKWQKARNLMVDVARNRPNTGVINYFSGAGKLLGFEVLPYFIASGSMVIYGKPSLWTGLSKACWDRDWNTYPDFPRKSCAFCGTNTVCSIHFRGTNNLLYDWLVDGRLGNPQSREVAYVWPQKLGILVLDFPDNWVLNEIIQVNFETRNPYRGTQFIPKMCTELPCPACIAGDLNITTDTRGIVAARDVVVGDRVPGAQNGEWCEVVAAVRTDSNGTVYGNFTHDHLVAVTVEPTETSSPAYTVMPNGFDTPARQVDLVNIATTCPVVRAAGGELFTPLSTVFCTELTWDQYIPLYAAIMRVVAKTGTFWFDPSTYTFARDTDNLLNSSVEDSSSSDSPSDSEGTRDWMSELPGVCGVMLSCTIDGKNCDEFEELIAFWIQEYVPSVTYAKIKEVYPNLGNPNAEHGNLSEDVRPPRRGLAPAVIAVVVVVVVCLVILAVVFAIRWSRWRLRPKEVMSNNPTAVDGAM